MRFVEFVDWAFLAVVSGGMVFLVGILNEVKRSIQKLNERMAIIIEKTLWHEKYLDKHEERITKLELQ